MPLYQYECAFGHVTEVERRMADPDPGTIPCQHTMVRLAQPERVFPGLRSYPADPPAPDEPIQTVTDVCAHPARRVYTAPAAIHFRGPGFYSTDVKARQERKRRPNAGDDLYVGHDRAAAQIARSL